LKSLNIPNDVKILIVLVLVFVSLATTSAVRKSPVADEAAHHVPTGYVFLKTGDFVYATDSPALARYIASFPLLFMDVKLPPERSFWARDDRAEFSREFLYDLNRNIVGKIIFFARMPMIALGAFGGIFLFSWTKRRYGSQIAVLTSIFYFLSPNILAHARFATTDIAAIVFIMCSVLTFWDFLKSLRYKQSLIAGVFLGLAMMAKYSALLLLPLYFVLVFIIFIARILSKEKNSGSIFLMFLVFLSVSFLVLWAGYAFEFKPFLQDALRPEGKVDFFKSILHRVFPSASNGFMDKSINALYTVPMPLSSYILGVIGVLKHGIEGARTFFMGVWKQAGHPMYYLLAFFIKTPVPVIVTFFLGTFFLITRKEKRLLGVYLLFIIAAFFVTASRASLQLGLRYVLPVYPLIFVISAIGLSLLFQRGYLSKILGIVFVVWLFAVQIFIWPDYLSYFNELIGGPKNGYKYLRESNLDWGQDLPALRDFMAKENIDYVKLDYFGEGDPSLYDIKSGTIKRFEKEKPGDFVYAISVNYIDGYPWTQRKKPDARAGYSILIYDLREKR
jgi:hypothetical protein